MDDSLRQRLIAAGAELGADFDAAAAFELLLGAEGHGATLDDRLALEAASLGRGVDSLRAEDKRRAMLDFYGHRWEGFEIVGEERRDQVFVVDYDPRWPQRFTVWKQRLTEALGDFALQINHVGSTAVPGLAAKPIVDIQISVEDVADEGRYVPPIDALGVALRSRDVEHRYFRPRPGRPRDVQIHVCNAGSDWEREHLLFRDYLRAHDEERDAYASLKRRLATRFPDDRLAYTEAKGEFIRSALRAAETWSAGRPHVNPAE